MAENLSQASTDISRRDQKLKVVELYREHPELCNVQCEDYRNRDKKQKAYEEIAAELGTDKKSIASIINSLRTQFAKEHRAVTGRKPTGTAGGSQVVSVSVSLSVVKSSSNI
jgi:hypothetical protein